MSAQIVWMIGWIWRITTTRVENTISYAISNFQKAKVGPKSVQYGYPEVVMDYIRTLLPNSVKAEKRETAYPVSMAEFAAHILM